MTTAERLTAIATWLGTCTVAANAWPPPRGRTTQELGTSLEPSVSAGGELQATRANAGKLRDSQPAARLPTRRGHRGGQQITTKQRKGASAAVKALLPTPHRRRPACSARRPPAVSRPGRLPRTMGPAATHDMELYRSQWVSLGSTSGGRGRKRPIATLDRFPHCERWTAIRARVIAKLSSG